MVSLLSVFVGLVAIRNYISYNAIEPIGLLSNLSFTYILMPVFFCVNGILASIYKSKSAVKVLVIVGFVYNAILIITESLKV